jgi:hypothetical protein
MSRLHAPSPAIVVAIVALVFAASGTAVAVTKLPKNSVGTSQIKNRAVTTQKLAKSTAARVAGLTYVKQPVSADAQSAGVITVKCPSGLMPVGGGLSTPHTANSFLLDSHPTSTGWEVSAADASDTPETLTAYAVCVKAAPGTAAATKVGKVVHLRPVKR